MTTCPSCRCRQRWLFCRLLPFLLLTVVSIVVWMVTDYYGVKPNTAAMFYRLVEPTCSDPVDYRRRVAEELQDIAAALHRAAAYNQSLSPHVHLKLQNVISQLNPQAYVSRTDFIRSETLIRNIANRETNVSDTNHVPPYSVKQQELFDVCPEEPYKGALYDLKYMENNFKTSKCKNVKPLEDIVTVVINTIDYCESYLQQMSTVLDGVYSIYEKVPVLVATRSQYVKDIASNYPNVTVTEPSQYHSAGRVWNSLIEKVQTPYVLLTRDITHFHKHSRLERQIQVMSEVPNVVAVGGAFRNLTGHWYDGCYQSSIYNYFLQYTAGYKYSAKECMFCDYNENSFVSKTDIFLKFPLSDGLSADVIFQDWFLRIKNSNYLTMNCPDVMYFTRTDGLQWKTNRQAWLQLARKWEIYKIFIPPKTMHMYTCKEAKLSCNLYKSSWAYLYPPCCISQFTHALSVIKEFCDVKNISYQLDAGSTLGAVKLHTFLPWDIDGDIVLSKEHYSFFKDAMPFFESEGLTIARYEKSKYFVMYTPDITIEFYPQYNISAKFLPNDLINRTTLVNVGGIWVKASSNPGLWVRNRYGYNYLKHSQSWRQTVKEMAHSFESYDAGKWQICPRPSHHACLDQYPIDGNLQFVPDSYP